MMKLWTLSSLRQKNACPPPAYIGTISDSTAALVQEKTGVNIKGYDFVLASNFISHIFDSHGRTATEAPRGQTAVNYSNIENS